MIQNRIVSLTILYVLFTFLPFCILAQEITLCPAPKNINYCVQLDSLIKYTDKVIKELGDKISIEKNNLEKSKEFINELKININSIKSEQILKDISLCDSIIKYNLLAKNGYIKTKFKLRSIISNIKKDLETINSKILITKGKNHTEKEYDELVIIVKNLVADTSRFRKEIKELNEQLTTKGGDKPNIWKFICFIMVVVVGVISYLHIDLKSQNKILNSDIVALDVKNNTMLENAESDLESLTNNLKKVKENNNVLIENEEKYKTEIIKLNSIIKNLIPNPENLLEPNDSGTQSFIRYYHFNIEPDGKSFRISKATSEKTSRSLYEIKESDSKVLLYLLETDYNTRLLIDYSKDHLEPFYHIPSPAVVGIQLIKTDIPAKLKRQGDFWILETKGTVKYS